MGSTPCWMVRAAGGTQSEAFAEKGCVALGWPAVGDLSDAKDREQIRDRIGRTYPEYGRGKLAGIVGMLHRFRCVLQRGDAVVTYDPATREYFVGEIESDYVFDPTVLGGSGEQYPHLRRVAWKRRVSRDSLSAASRNVLGGTLSLFALPEETVADLAGSLPEAPERQTTEADEEREALVQTKEDAVARAFELIKDRIVRLGDSEMEELVAAILRAMGYKARVSPTGPDRGVDVFASPDGLGLEVPRIKAEVKHRARATMGSQDIRSFLGGLREGDRGLFVSTGGFTREAHYEAERSTHPITLVDLDTLASLVVAHYESFDIEARVLLPLVKVLVPA